MGADLEKAAMDAIRSAAERLGVDPFRLACFLANGRLADFLQALGESDLPMDERAHATRLTHAYLEFLEEEMRRCREEQESDALKGR